MRHRLRAIAESLVAAALLVSLFGVAWRVWVPVRVSGGSMSPALNSGDLVIVRRNLRPREGTIVLAKADSRGAVLHRVVMVGHDGSLTTRGDANLVNDTARTRQVDVGGVVVGVIPVGTLLRRWRGVE
jgi:signal peptidase I